ncbi:Phytanoyl-CoA dioxygenase [Mycena venus]|uniref:Phytanoyl-CoA dioxygenase n=1 Tax=Mycena venus TaxID=2733690 RepID=A0A8H6YP49_9AGAR|nr:Phytanoyl-CoA dioxygenase [Mycena venus]
MPNHSTFICGHGSFVETGVPLLIILPQSHGELNSFCRYLVIPGFVTPEDVATLLARSKALLQEFSIEDHPLVSRAPPSRKTKFTTGDDDHVGDAYFLESGDKMYIQYDPRCIADSNVLSASRYFLEEEAVVDGKLTRPKEFAVNKIGHGDGRTQRFNIFAGFQYTDPPSALGFWIALEQCTASNGALSFLPGSHLTTPITKRFVRLPAGGTGFEPLVTSEIAEQVAAQSKASSDSYILETCEPGE